MTEKEKQPENPTNLLDNVLLLSMNETAFQNGFIDESTKEAIRNKIISSERKLL